MTDLNLLKPGMHVLLTPQPKFPNMDTDIIIFDIVDDWGEKAILYNVSETCDGYVIPFSWIKSFEIISD